MIATRIHRQLLLLLALLLALGLAACKSTSTDPNEPTLLVATQGVPAEETSANLKSGFYPLQQGNQWDYRRTSEFQIIPDTGPPSPPELPELVILNPVMFTQSAVMRTTSPVPLP